MNKIHQIRSGGQTGVDRAALDAAKSLNIPICGWIPKGGWAEDMSEPHTLLTLYPELTETPTKNIKQRTRWNVRDSHATLIISPTEALTGGTLLTYRIAQELKRPCFVHQTNWHEDLLMMWLGELPNEIILNVAGPRESKNEGIYDDAYEVLEYVFEEMR
jgi:predicted Rossmann fold nucleotide-binding protein DprA/Smf involved in DNA uptake